MYLYIENIKWQMVHCVNLSMRNLNKYSSTFDLFRKLVNAVVVLSCVFRRLKILNDIIAEHFQCLNTQQTVPLVATCHKQIIYTTVYSLDSYEYH